MFTAQKAREQTFRSYEKEWPLAPDNPHVLYCYCIKKIKKQSNMKQFDTFVRVPSILYSNDTMREVVKLLRADGYSVSWESISSKEFCIWLDWSKPNEPQQNLISKLKKIFHL